MKTEWIIPKCLSQILCYKADAFLFPQCNDFRGYSSKSLKISVLSVLVQTHAVWQRTCWPLTSCGILQYRRKKFTLVILFTDHARLREILFLRTDFSHFKGGQLFLYVIKIF